MAHGAIDSANVKHIGATKLAGNAALGAPSARAGTLCSDDSAPALHSYRMLKRPHGRPPRLASARTLSARAMMLARRASRESHRASFRGRALTLGSQPAPPERGDVTLECRPFPLPSQPAPFEDRAAPLKSPGAPLEGEAEIMDNDRLNFDLVQGSFADRRMRIAVLPLKIAIVRANSAVLRVNMANGLVNIEDVRGNGEVDRFSFRMRHYCARVRHDRHQARQRGIRSRQADVREEPPWHPRGGDGTPVPLVIWLRRHFDRKRRRSQMRSRARREMAASRSLSRAAMLVQRLPKPCANQEAVQFAGL